MCFVNLSLCIVFGALYNYIVYCTCDCLVIFKSLNLLVHCTLCLCIVLYVCTFFCVLCFVRVLCDLFFLCIVFVRFAHCVSALCIVLVICDWLWFLNAFGCALCFVFVHCILCVCFVYCVLCFVHVLRYLRLCIVFVYCVCASAFCIVIVIAYLCLWLLALNKNQIWLNLFDTIEIVTSRYTDK